MTGGVKKNKRKSLSQMAWKAPVTSRQRRWLNRPSTEALDVSCVSKKCFQKCCFRLYPSKYLYTRQSYIYSLFHWNTLFSTFVGNTQDNVFGLYPLSDVEHMCRVIW